MIGEHYFAMFINCHLNLIIFITSKSVSYIIQMIFVNNNFKKSYFIYCITGKMDNYLLFKTLDSQKDGYLTIQEFLNVFEASPLKWKVLLPILFFIISKNYKFRQQINICSVHVYFIIFSILYIKLYVYITLPFLNVFSLRKCVWTKYVQINY